MSWGGAGAALTLFVMVLGATVIWLAVTADDSLDLIRRAAVEAVPISVVALPDHPEAAAPSEVTPDRPPEPVRPEPGPVAEPEPPQPPDVPAVGPAAEPSEDPPPPVQEAPAQLALAPPQPPDIELTPPELALPPTPGVAWRANARPFDLGDSRPRIAIIITDLGLTGSATEAAIQNLPGAVTLAFAPYARNLEAWMPQARAAGHEVLMMMPMEPQAYPLNDPGPHTLLTDLPTAQNRARLDWVLGRTDGIVGIVSEMGSRFTRFASALRPVIAHLGENGLIIVDGGATVLSAVDTVAEELGVPYATADRVLDDVLARDAIDARLAELEALAQANGVAIGIAAPYPVVLERLSAWFPTMRERGFALAPVTAIAAGGGG